MQADREDSPLSVLVVGRDALARRALTTALQRQPGVVVSAELTEGPRLREALRVEPGVVLWDLGPGPETDAASLTSSDVPVLALVNGLAAARSALDAGATGVLERDVDADRLAAALIAVDRGLWVVDPRFGEALLANQAGLALTEALTPREVEVLQWLAEGLSNRQIAGEIGVSAHTVKFHVNAILGKLGASTRTEAVVRAARAGVLRL